MSATCSRKKSATRALLARGLSRNETRRAGYVSTPTPDEERESHAAERAVCRVEESCVCRYVETMEGEEPGEDDARAVASNVLFDEGLGISAEAFLEAFRDADYAYTSAYNLLQQRNIKIGRERVRDLVHALYNGYPDLYEKYCSVPPPGVAARGSAKVISIDSWEN